MNVFSKSCLSCFVLSASLLVGCHDDPEQRLGQAFAESDRIEMKMLVEEILVDGIKFSYSTDEDKLGLLANLRISESSDAKCLIEMGRLIFLKEEKVSAELLFNASDECLCAWFEAGMDDQAFAITDRLATVIQKRYNLVLSVKGPKPK